MSRMTVDPGPARGAPAPQHEQPQPAPAAAGDPVTQDAAATPHRDGGYRDTIESILIAFILAFIFRAFVVEAFVIPTGSMAPTLLGAHARFVCDDCGYAFEANYTAPTGNDQDIRAEVGHAEFPSRGERDEQRTIDCPNCGHTVHDPDDTTRNDRVPIHYGDRILVLKYAYLLSQPKRWDVVVFKSPDDPDSEDADHDPDPPNDYGKTWYTTNFIKRLVGRPHESVMIVDGDVYVAPDADAGAPDSPPPPPGEFQIQSKPRHVQDALWRIVCDADFIPRHERWRPWVVESGAGWDVGTPEQPKRVYTFDSAAAGGTIRFDNDFLPEKQYHYGRPFTDELAYAQARSGRNNVSDAKLSVTYRRKSGDGPLRLSLRKRDDTFTAELTPGAAKLFRKTGKPAGPDDLGEEVGSASNLRALGTSSPVQVEFMNVDHRVTLRVDGRDVLHTSYDPDVAALIDQRSKPPKPEVRVTAVAQTCALSHVSLWRDVYYTNDQNKWARPDDPVRLGPKEYFVLGDNTVISKDARYWTDPVRLPAEDLDVQAGRVPERFMLGKAFFVYWPAGYRPFGSSTLPGIIPNFGAMRFIH
jgi:signal peptidase I